jgi:hypothetical protein
MTGIGHAKPIIPPGRLPLRFIRATLTVRRALPVFPQLADMGQSAHLNGTASRHLAVDRPRQPDRLAANIPIARLFQIINFATFGGEACLPNHSSMVRMTMPHSWPNTSVPEPVKDQQPLDDFFASRLADRIRMEAWRKKLAVIRAEILEIAEQGSQQGLVDLQRETVELARTLEHLETLLGLANK